MLPSDLLLCVYEDDKKWYSIRRLPKSDVRQNIH